MPVTVGTPAEAGTLGSAAKTSVEGTPAPVGTPVSCPIGPGICRFRLPP